MKIKRLFGLLLASIGAVSAYGQVSDLEKLKQEGRDLIHMEKYHEALTKFNEVLNVSPNEQEAMYEQAFCLSKLKANREAKEILEESIKIKDRPYSLLHEYNLLGNLYSDEGRQLEAIECYEKAIPLLEPGSNVIAAKLYHNISNELFGLSAENREKRKDWNMEALNYAGMAIKHLPIHSNAYYIVGNILSTKKAYYQALSFYVISALFSGKGTADIEDDLATWKSMGLILECGDETVMAFNIVNELMQKKPSEYGKLYDVFSAVFSGAMKHSNETPLPVAYSGDTWEQSLLPFLAELSRKGLLECFCHLAMVNSRKYGMANEKWLEKNDDKCKELNKYINDTKIFDDNLDMGFIPEPFDFKTAEEAHKHITDAMGCCRYYVSHFLNDPKMEEAKKYIASWSAVSSDVKIKTGPAEEKIFSRHPELQTFYNAACISYALSRKESEFSTKAYSCGLYVIAWAYPLLKKEKNIATDDELERLCELYNNDKEGFEKYAEENYSRIR